MTDKLIERDEDTSASNWGLTHVYDTRGEMNKSCDAYMAKAKSVDVIAFGLKSWRDSQQGLSGAGTGSGLKNRSIRTYQSLWSEG